MFCQALNFELLLKLALFLLQDPSGPLSLVQGKLAQFEPSQKQSTGGVVQWSPPQVNWNPWTSSNIDEGPLAFVSWLYVAVHKVILRYYLIMPIFKLMTIFVNLLAVHP